jgi:hypothetical protein
MLVGNGLGVSVGGNGGGTIVAAGGGRGVSDVGLKARARLRRPPLILP